MRLGFFPSCPRRRQGRVLARRLVPGLLALALFSPGARADAEARLRSAEAHIARGDERAAADIYRELLERGHDGAALRYNLGTLRLAEGAVGHAVLHLRSALRLDPTLEDAAQNLSVALEARADPLFGPAEGEGNEASLGQLLSPRAAAWLLWLSCAALGLGLGLRPWLPPGRPRRTALGLSAPALLLTLVSGSFYAYHGVRFHRREVVVISPKVAGRAAPDANASVAFEVRAGAWGVPIESEGDFVRVRLSQGLDAWLPRESVAEVGSVPPPPRGP